MAHFFFFWTGTSGAVTRTRILALAVRSGSRAEQLFGVGTVIAPSTIAQALRG